MYPQTETLSIFVAQALSADRSCQRAVDNAAVLRAGMKVSAGSTHTEGFCRARAPLRVHGQPRKDGQLPFRGHE